ncbi:MAG: hypothetical protein COV57_01155 [Candidatus Liptonbacteria bacterium CG11_big_fil_rev_8_21_14_0_20_35_14]|uniref:DoxX family protein n=1 Tax=Candidatus Liptonbacteria bacterium CG11_big_fil_rev_8_21_14_0_20_35_14 TaxID=1974634 RepID=A0A2H0N818_9BACT|nr:MAG: hypothetical protein COV57_01155 [Candidatus Liptonbacteria bacterium CG11_big_fil_rev_8_21_14_0_20_35_14]
MKSLAYPILRLGLGITFVWMGVLIFQNPGIFGDIIASWATDFLVIDTTTVATIVAVVDVIIGALMIVNFWTRLAAIIGAIHLLIVFVITFGNDATSARELGLLAATLSLFLNKN